MYVWFLFYNYLVLSIVIVVKIVKDFLIYQCLLNIYNMIK